MGELLQPARPDAVGAFLVFLHLLEGEAECGSPAFPGSFEALGGAFAPGCRRAGRWGSGPSSRQIVSEPPWLTARQSYEQKSSRRWDIRHPDSTSNFWTKVRPNSTYLDNDLHFLDSHLNDLRFEIEIRASRGTIP